MESNTIFVDGMEFNKPSDKPPEFIKGKISIHAARLTAFIEEHKNERGYLNIDLCKSAKGNLYLKLNTYKKEGAPTLEASDIPFDPPAL